VSGAENGAERAENGMSGSGAVSAGVNKYHLSGAERAKSGAQIRSYQHCVDSDIRCLYSIILSTFSTYYFRKRLIMGLS